MSSRHRARGVREQARVDGGDRRAHRRGDALGRLRRRGAAGVARSTTCPATRPSCSAAPSTPSAGGARPGASPAATPPRCATCPCGCSAAGRSAPSRSIRPHRCRPSRSGSRRSWARATTSCSAGACPPTRATSSSARCSRTRRPSAATRATGRPSRSGRAAVASQVAAREPVPVALTAAHGPSGSRTASIAARRWRAMPARPPSSSASRCARAAQRARGAQSELQPEGAIGGEEVRRAQVPRRSHDADARGHAEGQDDRQRPRRVLRRVAARHLEQHRHVGQRPLAPHLLGLRQAVRVGVAGQKDRADRRLPAQGDRAGQARPRVRGDAVLGADPGLAVAEDDGDVVAVATARRAQARRRPRGRTGRSGTGGRAAARPARRARSVPRGPHAAPRPSPRRSR